MPTKFSAFGDSKAVISDEGDEKKKSSSKQQTLEGSQIFQPSASYCYLEKCVVACCSRATQ